MSGGGILIEREPLRREFRARYGRAPRLFRAPGRVNLIGEHTDYNGGFVLPLAIDRETIVAAAAREDRLVRVHSLNLGESAEFDLDRPGEPRRGRWLDYLEGVARALEARGARLSGADLLIRSDVPAGAGLSSSAALEVSAGLAFATLSGARISLVELALAGQQAEHTYVGTMCGIMDQLVSALGQAGRALLIDCRSLETTPVTLETERAAIVVCDTRVKHELSSSEYNTRRAECARGVELLREFLPGVTELRDVSVGEFRAYEGRLPEPVRSRCRHVVTENERTLRAAESLSAGDLDGAGRLMYESHDSLRRDYEVSCAELDRLVGAAASSGLAFGSRMTGGGFGGSTVSLVRRDALAEFTRAVAAEYAAAFGFEPAVYVAEASDGAGEVADDS